MITIVSYRILGADALCYNAGMFARLLFIAWSLFFTITGCASTEETTESPPATNQITFPKVKATPESFIGQTVMFGGQVLNARQLKEGTRIEVLQLPLDQSGLPAYELTQSQGRFIGMHREFLDPATLPHGTRITITGELTGSVVLPLDEMEYAYPLIDVKHLHVWPSPQQATPRIGPYMGPGPYWSPFWRPWPYYW